MNTNGMTIDPLTLDLVDDLPAAMGPLKAVLNTINQFYSLTDALMLAGAVIAIGYGLKGIKRFPNGAIPFTLIVLAALGSVLLQPDAPSGVSWKAWNTKNALCGLAVGFVAWRFHKGFLSKVDGWFSKWFGVKPDTGNSDPAAFVKDPIASDPMTRNQQTPPTAPGDAPKI